MRIAMIGAGSRGDVQPTVVLGAELAGRGHDVVVSLPSDLVDFGSRLGLATAPLGFRAELTRGCSPTPKTGSGCAPGRS